MTDERHSDEITEPVPEKRNWLEWTVLSTGILLVLFTVGYLIREVVHSVNEIPVLNVETGGVIEVRGTFYVPVEIENVGGSVAVDANVEVCGETGECAEMSFQFVPRKSKRQGTVGFSRHPGENLTHRVTGYRIP